MFHLGYVTQYVGLSMLIGKNLMMAAAGNQSGTRVKQDPNGIVAFAQGDLFCWCLATKSFKEGCIFPKLICLQYPDVVDSIKQ